MTDTAICEGCGDVAETDFNEHEICLGCWDAISRFIDGLFEHPAVLAAVRRGVAMSIAARWVEAHPEEGLCAADLVGMAEAELP